MDKNKIIQKLESIVIEMRKEIKRLAPNGEYPDEWSGDACALADSVSDYADNIEDLLNEAKSS